ncbi:MULTISPECIES: luciferase domain-containing protein [Micrococcaceae]|uniref:luciferase domain-containing protein n=1 Tax=Micrococcaceae TaxID=1268 RepID=UPI0009DFF45F|nr:luciferase family protein [Arthrobacter sp. MA-N2]
MALSLNDLPLRPGAKPSTTPSNPHTQLEQVAPPAMQDRARDHALSLPGVRRGPSHVSVPGSVAFYLDSPVAEPSIPDLFGGEWGHIHPPSDGSLHLNVPTDVAQKLIAAGWAEHHSLVGKGYLPPIVIMVYGPRDEGELAVVKFAIEQSYLAAGGSLA